MAETGQAGLDDLDFAGKSVLIVGRLESLGCRATAALIRARRGRVGRSLGRRTGYLVVGHHALDLVAAGVVQARLAEADRAGIPCLSENAFLRALNQGPTYTGAASAPVGRNAGLVAGPSPGIAADAGASAASGAFGAAEIARMAGLPSEMLRLLALLDIIELDRGRGGFPALAAARQAARLLQEGISVAALTASVRQLLRNHRPEDPHPLARFRFDLDEHRRPVLRIGKGWAEADGQLRLVLPESSNPVAEDLLAGAEAAEAAGEWQAAETLYRRCVNLDHNDPMAPFNLATVLCEQNRPREAALFFQMALARDPDCAAAWYNLAHLAEAAGDLDTARDRLQHALGCSPDFADAVYNLARLHYHAGAYARAAEQWRHYLELDPDSDWARKARSGIALCRQHLR